MLLDRGVLVREKATPTGWRARSRRSRCPETLQALIAARLDGLVAGGAADRPARGRARADVHAARARVGVGDAPRTSSSRSSLAGAQGGALAPGGSAVAGARPVRVPPGPRQEGRLRHALARRSGRRGIWQRPRICDRSATTKRWWRSSRPTTSTPIAPPRRRRCERRSAPRPATMLVRAGRARGVARGQRRGAARITSRPSTLADDSVLQADLHERAGIMARIGARPEAPASTSSERSRCFKRRADASRSARGSPAGGGHVGHGPCWRRASSAWTVRSSSCRRRSRTRTWRSSRRRSDASCSSPASSTSRSSGSRRRSSWPRRLPSGSVLAGAQHQGDPARLPRADAARGSHCSASRSTWRSRTTSRRRRSAPTYNLADSLSKPTATRRRRPPYGTGSLMHVASATASRSCSSSRRLSAVRARQVGRVLEWASALPEDWRNARQAYSTVGSIGVIVRVHTGRLDEARHWVELLDEFSTSSDAQEHAAIAAGKGRLLLAQGDPGEAFGFAQVAIDSIIEMGINQEYVKEALVTGLEAALELRDTARVEALLSLIDEIPPRRPAQFLRAQALRFRAGLAALAQTRMQSGCSREPRGSSASWCSRSTSPSRSSSTPAGSYCKVGPRKPSRC